MAPSSIGGEFTNLTVREPNDQVSIVSGDIHYVKLDEAGQHIAKYFEYSTYVLVGILVIVVVILLILLRKGKVGGNSHNG